jgi:hypothetical protein
VASRDAGAAMKASTLRLAFLFAVAAAVIFQFGINH